jgi:hypothetical protein
MVPVSTQSVTVRATSSGTISSPLQMDLTTVPPSYAGCLETWNPQGLPSLVQRLLYLLDIIIIIILSGSAAQR